jgi:replicative DNA helicase
MLEMREAVLPETNGNVRKYLLKSLLKKKFYDKFQKYNLGDVYNHNIYKCIDSIYRNDKELESISTEYLADFYEKQYGSRMGFNQLSGDKNIIFGLDKVKEPNEKTVDYILNLTHKQKKAEELTKKSFALVNNPDKYDFSEIKNFVQNIGGVQKEYESKMDRINADPLQLIEDEEKFGNFKFNIKRLQDATHGVGGGNFVVVFARPEAGKSAFWVSLVANKNGFAEQGKKCHAFINEEPAKKTYVRLISCWTGIVRDLIKERIEEVRREWSVIKDNIFVYDSVDVSMDDLNNYCEENEVDIIIIDQLDKINIRGNYNAQHEKLKEIYKQARELAKRNNVLVIGISQAGAEAHNQQRIDFNWLDNSKTGKAGEADLIIGIGKPRDSDKDYDRWLYLSKNKLTGEHIDIECSLNHTLSRYE